jgi:hypothetical protein
MSELPNKKWQPLYDGIVELGLKWIEAFEEVKFHDENKRKITDAIFLLKLCAELLITDKLGKTYRVSWKDGEMVMKEIKKELSNEGCKE